MKHKHADLIHAWADGAKIQFKANGKWRDVGNPSFYEVNEYRIKPEPVVLYVNEYEDGLGGVCTSFEEAVSIKAEKRVFIRTIKLQEVEDENL